jgi:fermentation-respiration switch protein FrsA (DUF1100 family)
MTRWQIVTRRVVILSVAASLAGLAFVTRARAHTLITNPRATRHLPTKTPADLHLPYTNVTVTTADGLTLVGWDLPSQNRAEIVFLHGYKDHRGTMLNAAALYQRHGYGVLLASVRAHDQSDGEQISFGHREMQDVEAWYRYVVSRPGIDPNDIGILGVSMGGSLAIEYAAQNPHIRAVVADSAFSSLDDTVTTSVKFFTGLPAFPFVPLIRLWAEREGGYDFSEIDAKQWIGHISPRPVLLMQGGADVVISPRSGELLYEAAGEPKELWFEPTLGHARFLDDLPQEYERRVMGFLDHYMVRR